MDEKNLCEYCGGKIEWKMSKWEIFNYATLVLMGLMFLWIIFSGGIVKERVVVVDLNRGEGVRFNSIGEAKHYLEEVVNRPELIIGNFSDLKIGEGNG